MENKIKTVVFITDIDENTRIIGYDIRHVIEGDSDKLSLPIPSVKYTPTKGDKIWFYPGCNVPRFKVKQFCNNNGVSVVKYKEKSSVKFMGIDTIKEMFYSTHISTTSKDYFLAWLETVMCNAYLQLKEDIIKIASDIIYFDDVDAFCNEDMFGKKILYQENDLINHQFITCVKDDESYQQIVDMMNDPNLRDGDDLLSLLNTGIVMDQKMYDDIHRLFDSTDNDNVRLAMEAMANCDFQKSAVYLLLLLREYGKKIDNSGVHHHVNFKSLLKYFKITRLHDVTVDDMINSLRHQKLLNVENLNRLMPLAMKVIREEGELENIKIKDVELSTEAELSITENILDQQIVTVSPIPDTPDTEHAKLFAQTQEFHLGVN